MPENIFDNIEFFRNNSKVMEITIDLENHGYDFWNYIASNDITARIAGKPPTTFEYEKYNGIVLLKNELNYLGIKTAYYELPFEWNKPFYSGAECIFTSGPLSYFKVRNSINKENNKYKIITKIDYLPRMPILGELFAKFFVSNYIKAYKKLDKILPDQNLNDKSFFSFTRENLDSANRLSERWKSLGLAPDIAAKFSEYIYTAPEKYLRKIRPFEIANIYNFDKTETLKFFLSATKSGYLDMYWELICPSCKGSTITNKHLADINNGDIHCEGCNISYDLSFDKNVEVTFTPHIDTKKVDLNAFCLGSPGNTPHIFAQTNLIPYSENFINLEFPDKNYLLRTPDIKENIFLEVNNADGLSEIEINCSDFPLTDKLLVKDKFKITFKNNTSKWYTFRIDDLSHRTFAATAHFVTSLQEFRTTFGSEVLKPGVNIGISNVVLLFTDLKDSTLMYENIGDAPAFSLVQQHFDLMETIISDNNGGIVKTIGDAVMATFISSSDAIKCSFAIIEKFTEWNKISKENIVVNLGLHKGPCIAINMNDSLDYFGATVNKAARIQAKSKEGKIVISETLFNDPNIQNFLKDNSNITYTSFETELKGIEGSNLLFQLG